MSTDSDDHNARVRGRYAAAAAAATAPDAPDLIRADERGTFGAGLYGDEAAGLPATATGASLGCGNPLAVLDLHPGETVLDLGSGGGLDVLLSARRVGPNGRAIGLDMTDEMLELARRNAADAGATNVEFIRGQIEQIPLPDTSVDAVISNCVITLSADKNAVFAELSRVLRPGGRVGISDLLADDDVTDADRTAAGAVDDPLATSLTAAAYTTSLLAAGLTEVLVQPTHRAGSKAYAAIIQAVKPRTV